MGSSDPLDCPAVHHPARGGPRLAELEAAMRALSRTAWPASASVTTWVVDRDADGRSERSAKRVLAAILDATPT